MSLQDHPIPNLSKPAAPRQLLLEEAMKITSRDRNSAYGNPEDNFQNIANLWNAYFQPLSKGIPNLSSMDVANLMILMKVARLATNPTHHDSAVDVAGYAACLADCQDKHQREREKTAGLQIGQVIGSDKYYSPQSHQGGPSVARGDWI